MIDICIIGGGAAGLVAAIKAGETNKNLKIAILEKKKEVGSKLVITGNGKCNISNKACDNYEETEDFFYKIGIPFRCDTEGRAYPYTEDGKAVRNALVNRAEALGVKISLGVEAEEVQVSNESQGIFLVKTNKGVVKAKKLLITTGGKSMPKTGSTGDGFRFAKKLGHTVNKVIPALTAVETQEDISKFKGIRAKCNIKLLFKNKEIFSQFGEVQFTEKGISGICVFNMTRYLLIPEDEKDKGFKDYKIIIDFLPEIEDIGKFTKERMELPFYSGENIARNLVKPPIEKDVYEKANGDSFKAIELLKAYSLTPLSLEGWGFAQVTKGGVCLSELNLSTMESKLVKNLYFAGEVIDFDGPCGGYNLQNAWETGFKAGRSMANGEI